MLKTAIQMEKKHHVHTIYSNLSSCIAIRMRPFKPHQNVSKHRLVPFFLENSFANQLMTPIVEGSSWAVLATAWCFWDSASYEDGMIIQVESGLFFIWPRWISRPYFGSVVYMTYLVGGLEHACYFSIYWQESSQLTNIFQRCWNHQPDMYLP